ncbi:MAG: hypothetical protein MZV70_68030 [Desulfobacterales bacterium]|nr:hypothetical protein [Desulfobacterales bacterium]
MSEDLDELRPASPTRSPSMFDGRAVGIMPAAGEADPRTIGLLMAGVEASRKETAPMSLVFEKRKTVSKPAIVARARRSPSLASLAADGASSSSPSAPIRFATYAAMFKGAFGCGRGFTETLVKAMPLMLTGLGVALAFKLQFWNIGAEGQLTLGRGRGGLGGHLLEPLAACARPPARG